MFTLSFLREQETIREGIYGELKIETQKKRVWINENNVVVTERLGFDGVWEVLDDEYVATDL